MCRRPLAVRSLVVIAAALAGLWLGLTAAPAGALEGRLRLPDGEPAAGFHLSVTDQPAQAVTDGQGRFVLVPEPSPPFHLLCADPGGELYAPLLVERVVAGVALDLQLEPVLRDAVTVVAGSAPSIDLAPGAAAAVVTQEQIEQRRPARLFEVVDAVPGSSRLGEGADSVPVLRGLGRGRTLILVDGARVTAERRAGPSATFLDPATLGAVEVARGPGSVAYGSDAFGGVIFARTRDPEPGRRHARVALSGSYGGSDERGAAAELSLPVGASGLLVEAHGRETGALEASGGERIPNSAAKSHGAGLRWVRHLGTGRLRLGLGVDRGRDLGKAASDSNVVRAIYPTEDSDRFTGEWQSGPVGAWQSFETAIFFGRYRLVLDRDRLPTAVAPRRIDRSDTEARDASLRAVGARSVAGGRMLLGVEAVSRFGLRAQVVGIDFNSAGSETRRVRTEAIADASQVDLGLFATWNRALQDRLLFSAGLRGDRVRASNRGGYFGDRDHTNDALSGQLALTAGPFADVTTTLQLARGFRSPTLSDRFFRGPSGRGFVIGNPSLRPEASWQLDLTSRWTQGGTSVGLAVYRYRFHDLIERYRSGADFQFRNRGTAETIGAEVDAQIPLAAAFAVQLGASWSRGEDPRTGEAIADLPAPGGFAELRWADERGYAYARLATALAFRDPGPAEARRAGFTTLELGGGWDLTSSIELQATVRNLTDRRNVGSPDETATIAPGRTWTLGLTGRL